MLKHFGLPLDTIIFKNEDILKLSNGEVKLYGGTQ